MGGGESCGEEPARKLIGKLRHDLGGEKFQRVQHLLILYAAEVDEENQVLGARVAQLPDPLGDVISGLPKSITSPHLAA